MSEKGTSMQGALSAIKFLTLWGRFHEPQLKPNGLCRIAVYFPFLGTVLGLVLSVLNHLFEAYLPSEVLSVSLVAGWAIITGGIHLEGLHRTFDGVAGNIPFGKEKYGIGTPGLMTVILIILFKVNSLEAIGETRNLILVLAPTLARWSIVVLLYGASSAADFIAPSDRVPAAHLVLSTAFVLALTVSVAGETGLWIALCISVLALLVRTVICWRHAQVSHDHLGALVELSEALSVVAFATL